MMDKIGPTGGFPRGKLAPDDEGELVIGMRTVENKEVVVLKFGTPVTWMALPYKEAIDFALQILIHVPSIYKTTIELESGLKLSKTKGQQDVEKSQEDAHK